ncbi:hypothetical protein [Enhygromyxa salina]|uniref:Uncharacterized protein n=1 Tax=Enhygromyxa salina TaxID=215803 RepID=A0A2S9XQL9_9BACT|nr:hypothetical protein [Enhygromyxa salina]PRP95158.1 hypothetical protein ENSA7_74720 [Enhygromyxa salina]
MSDLVAQLMSAGQLEAKGGFTIDPEKAREKLRQYQLADPRCYVLLLVEAASTSGASKLEFEIDSDDLHLRFEGAVFGHEQLENIYGSLFASAQERGESPLSAELDKDLARLRGLQQLAFALNSAMALNPKFARVVSVAADGTGTALELRPDQPDEVSRVTDQPPGNWIHVKDRFRPGLIVEFFRSLGDTLAEVTLLRERCRWSRIPVFVNGKQISGPMELAGESWTQIDVVDEGVTIGRAALGLRANPEQAEFDEPGASLVSNGVFMERRTINYQAVPGFEAIVDSPRFGKDVSQTKLLHDSGYLAVIDAIIHAQDQMILRLAERRVAGAAPAWADQTLRTWLAKRAPDQLSRALAKDPVFAAVAEVALWSAVGGPPLSTRALIESKEPIRHAHEDFPFAPPDVPFVVYATPGPDEELLEQLFGARLHDHTSALRREAARQQRRLVFLTRRHAAELGEGYYVIREPISLDRPGEHEDDSIITVRGELGLRSLGHRDSWLRLISEGCLLDERALDGPIPGLCVVVSAEFTANDSYDDARPTPALAAALVAVLEALGRGLAKLAEAGTVTAKHVNLRALLRIYVQEVCRRDYGLSLLSAFGFSRKQAQRELERGAIKPVWNLEAARDGATEAPHPLARVPLYDCASGPPRSLAELATHCAQGQRLAWLEAAQIEDAGPLPELGVEVLVLERADREAIRELLGKGTLDPFAERLAWLRRRAAFLDRPEHPPTLSRAALCSAELRSQAPKFRGELGLSEFAFTAASEGRTPVDVYYCERALCRVDIDLPLPGLTVWVESDEFEVTPTFESLANFMTLRPTLLRGIAGLVERELERVRTSPHALLRCEWWWLAMIPGLVLGSGGLAQAFVSLRHQLGAANAVVELGGLLELLEQFPARDIDRALGTLRGRGQQPNAEAVRERLGRASRRPTEAEMDLTALRRGLLPMFVELLELRLFHRLDLGARGKPGRSRVVTLDELFIRVGAGQPISFVSESFTLDSRPDTDLEILSLDPIEHRVLTAVFGAQALEQVSEWLLGRARFIRRRKISEIRVARGSALITIRVDEPGVRGELGIAIEPAKSIERSRIRVFTKAREVTVVDFPARPLALVGALEVDELTLNDAHDDVAAPERDRVRQFVQNQVDTLLTELAARYADMSAHDKPIAAGLVRHLLDEWPPGVGGYDARSSKRRVMFKRLAALPVFAGARKPWSAAELADARQRGPIPYLAYRRPKLELPDGPVVVLDADDVESTLRALFGSLKNLEAELARARALSQRKSAAARMPSEPPQHPMSRIPVDAEGLEGWLWLAQGEAQVLFGEHGRVVDKHVVSDVCWCAGMIWGPGLSIAEDWSRVSLSRGQARLLERLACDLWGQAIDEFERRCDGEAPRGREQRRAFTELRDALHGLFMRLHERRGHSQSKRGRKRKGKRNRDRGDQYQQLYARVSAVPVLKLSTGRWISADVAARERPIELASLSLWTGPSAEELAHQRAVAQAEAERAREQARERARERQVEQTRRRAEAEAEARARETERRREAEREAKAAVEREQARAKPKPSKPSEPSEPSKPSKPSKRKKPKQPRPELLLLEAMRDELRLVRASNDGLVANHVLESLVLGEPQPRGPLFAHADGVTKINVGHPLVLAVLDGYLRDQTLLTLLASSAYTYLNLVHEEIEDRHEDEFLRLHAAHAATGG